MLELLRFSDNNAFGKEKESLQKSLEYYAALSVKEHEIHIKELPDMVNIALWDIQNEKFAMCRGWEYTSENYPIDRYTPIGVEVIPHTHMKDGKSRIMSLKSMSCDKPTTGDNDQDIYWGLYIKNIEGLEFKGYVPYITANGSTDFGDEQTINRWGDTYNVVDYFPSDMFTNIPNPFTKNQAYNNNDCDNFLPSPYDNNMRKNPIFFTENPNVNNSSCLLNMDGKGETAKLLSQIKKNGNADWKLKDTIQNECNSTNAPAAQCCWMYHISNGFKDNPIVGQGKWYLPTIGELTYVCVRQKAINASLNQINTVIKNSAITLSQNWLWSVSSCSDTTALGLSLDDGFLGNSSRYYKISSYVRAFALV